ncbi:MAG: DUF2203 domain-containing protein [Acidobacteria bacterium]|nr:DUF2203 domain-containing protein [Acidobacteriota bacterium]
MPRYFTLQQAQDTVEKLRGVIKAAVEVRTRQAEAEGELREAVQRAQVLGGVRLDPDRMALLSKAKQLAAVRLRECVEAIEESGAQLKDLDAGLLDFPTLYRGAEVLLCWRLGEAGIGYWHGLEEGFRGRKAIDRDFLDHHTGDEEEGAR